MKAEGVNSSFLDMLHSHMEEYESEFAKILQDEALEDPSTEIPTLRDALNKFSEGLIEKVDRVRNSTLSPTKTDEESGKDLQISSPPELISPKSEVTPTKEAMPRRNKKRSLEDTVQLLNKESVVTKRSSIGVSPPVSQMPSPTAETPVMEPNMQPTPPMTAPVTPMMFPLHPSPLFGLNSQEFVVRWLAIQATMASNPALYLSAMLNSSNSAAYFPQVFQKVEPIVEEKEVDDLKDEEDIKIDVDSDDYEGSPSPSLNLDTSGECSENAASNRSVNSSASTSANSTPSSCSKAFLKFSPKLENCSIKRSTSPNALIGEAAKPFTCKLTHCQKKFANKFLLKKHMFIHTGLKPHICPHCGKKFNRKDNLLRHRKTHTTPVDPSVSISPAMAAVVASAAQHLSYQTPANLMMNTLKINDVKHRLDITKILSTPKPLYGLSS